MSELPTSTSAIPPQEMTLDELKPLLVEAILPNVPFDGWSDVALTHAAEQIGIPPARARLVFPSGAADMVSAYIDYADARMLRALEAQDIMSMKIRARITTAVRTRLEQAQHEREAVRRALAVLGLPQNATLGFKTLWKTADAMWHAAGDTATDFNHYSKRAILGTVYSATLLVWLNDDSDGQAETWAFLDRRIEDVMKIEKAKARLRDARRRTPSLARFIGRLRYPAA